MKKLILITSALLTILAVSAHAQTAQEIIQNLSAEATAAYTAGDYETFIAKLEEVLTINDQLNPVHYNLACGYALTGQTDKAIDHLNILLERKMDYGIKRDPDFKSLHGDPRYQQIVAEFDRLFHPVNNSTRIAALDEPVFLPEGIAFDGASNRFFLGSMRHGTIVAVDRDGNASDFAALPNGNNLSVLGLEVDPERGLLWACGSAFTFAAGYSDTQQGTTGLFAFDLKTGKLTHTHMLPEKHPTGGFNDLTVASNGDIYLTGGLLYRCSDGHFETFLHDQINASNGITFDDDGTTLFIGDLAGIYAIDMKTNQVRLLDTPDDVATSGMDGMYYYNGSLVGIQHGQGPARAVRFTLNPDETAVTAMTILERNNPEFQTATTGALVGGEFFYVARGPVPAELPESVDPSDRLFVGETQIWHISLESL